jgi:uncharacterized protein
MIKTAWRRFGRRLLAPARRAALALVLVAPAWLAWGAEVAPTGCPPVARQPDAAELAQAAQRARDHGFLWRLRRDGRVSWLYGTIHVGRLDWAFPGPKVSAALHQAQLLALELDVGAAEVQQQLAAALARQEKERPSPPLSPALAQRLARQLAVACLSPALMAGQSPLMQVVTLSVLAARRDGLDPAYAQEFMLAGYVQARGQAVVSLEDAAGQLDALRGDDAAEELALLSQSLDQLDSGQARATLVRLAQAWADGDLDTLAHYDQWCDCARDAAERAFLARLNDDRNPALAGRIEALHASGKSVFAAVGALHMTGPRALPSLLRERGFEVEPVALARD